MYMYLDYVGGVYKLCKFIGVKIVVYLKVVKWYLGVMGCVVYLIDVSLMWWVVGCLGKLKKYIWYSLILKFDIILLDE